MTWREQLKATDPLAHEPGLTPADVEMMRASAIAAVSRPRRRESVRVSLALATALCAAVGAGWMVTQNTAPGPQGASSSAPKAPAPSDEGKRQVQFSTPGGTRVIWVLNPSFETR